MDSATVWPILLGGGISLVSSVSVFSLATWTASHQRTKEIRKAEANRAYHAFYKLLSTYNFIEKNAQVLDSAFNEFGGPNPSLEPAAFVRPIVSAGTLFELVTSEDLKFLLDSDGGLASRIYELQFRALHADVALTRFNRAREEYDVFLESHITSVDGGGFTFNLEGTDKLLDEVKAGSVNQIIGSLVEYFEKDRKEAKLLLQEFNSAARSHFGSDFPSLEF
ncbi:hypothetical protein [uncultured Sulfitobacter sp.]|uniref:hypothetical protein n=1 Tax=uncultured Sulfitobacter sp. TaxID=191468 RepID=UPI0026248EFB|nr:hypothetical protein [uncultured Sulfitobacter sp.]